MSEYDAWLRPILTDYQFLKTPLQFLLVFLVVSWLYFKIHGTYVAQLLKGVAVILACYVIANTLNLTIISGILQAVLLISVIGFIILFQPELRRLLVYLGQPDLFGRSTFASNNQEKQASFLVHELIESVRLLSRTKTGALIVLESASGMGAAYLEAGTRLDARLSTELLLTIFHTNTPLHDGAVIISPDNKIVAAGVLLPLSENPNLSWKYGTRHRAAIGLTEVSDNRCIVISEETGTISLAFAGGIHKYASVDELRQVLDEMYGIHSSDLEQDKKTSLGKILSTDLFQKFFIKTKATPPKKPEPEARARVNS